ncbi:hypothetical protein T8K17_23555 [Thalassobaculum sp. OXR-137]|uniref:hypothetical protein n=1 Tax=Thalassobaculum sp. OXR-137 TaxID=3100173 RepID=UPI002AC8F9F0|nr:hypothetical protein [Thalassobaculum sp. OXR-137]WPZ34195.1 hypothetical protein T8K17_23555 [Thalassobaculum sp. OXR-137]
MTDGASAPPPLPPGSGSTPAPTSTPAQSSSTQGPSTQTPSSQGQPAAGQSPNSQAAPAQGQTTAQQPASSSAQSQQPLPPDLARAQPGTVIEAEAVARNADGSVTLRTAQGDIRADLARSQVAELLKTGTRVTVELRNPGAAPPQLVVTIRPGGVTQPAVSTGASTPAPTVPLAIGRILQAVTVPGPSTAPVIPGGAPAAGAVPVGSPIPAPPPAAPAAQGATPLPGQSAPPAPGQPSPQIPGQAATPRGAPLPAGQPALPTAPAPNALAVQSAYRNALGLTGRADQAPPVPTTQTAPAGAPAGAASGGGLAAASAPGAAGGSQLPVGAVVTVRVLATGEEAARFLGARSDTPTAKGGGPSTVLSGTVSGVTQSGRPVVATPFGHLAINATSDLRIGDRVALDVLASRVGEMPTAERPAPLSVLAREWPALEGAMRVLQEALGPQAAAQITQAMVRPSPQMSAAMLFFMNALKVGDMRSWFGNDAARALESAGRGGLLSTLAEDFQTLQRAIEPGDNGWRAFLIPVLGEEKRPIRVLTRGRGQGKRDKDGNPADDGTAFLVDLELSQLGPFRLDGLVRNDLVDLWIRTTKPLPGLVRHDIKALFDGTLDRTGIQGRLAFKATPVLPPLPVAELQAGAAGDTESLFA